MALNDSEDPTGPPAIRCGRDMVAPGDLLRLEAPDGRSLVIARIGEEYFALDDRCTHGDASLSDGYLDGYILECPFHGGAFDVRDGRPAQLPCTRPLRSHPVYLDGEQLIITIQPG